MNILILSLKGPTVIEGGGAGEVIYQIGKRWVKKGFSVRVLTTQGKSLQNRELIDGIEVIRLGSLYTAPFLFMVEYLYNQRNWADVIIENMTSYPLYTPVYTRPDLVIVHNIKGSDYFDVHPFWKASIGYLSEKSIPFIYLDIPFVSVSQSTKKNLERLGIRDSRIEVIPNGVDVQKFRPGGKNKRPTVLYLGTIDKRKNVGDLIKAFELVLEEVPAAQLFVVGDGPDKSNLKRKAADLDNIYFFGHVSDSKKVDIYRSSWVYVLPSVKEGMPLAVLEANACGVPVIAYDVDGLQFIEESGNLIVEKGNVKRIFECITRVLLDDQLRRELEEKVLIFSKQFTWDKSSERYLDFINANNSN